MSDRKEMPGAMPAERAESASDESARGQVWPRPKPGETMTEFQPSNEPTEIPVAVATQGAVANVHYLNVEQREELRRIAKAVQETAIRLWHDRNMDLADALTEALAQHVSVAMTDRTRLRLLRTAVRSACFYMGRNELAFALAELEKGMQGSQE